MSGRKTITIRYEEDNDFVPGSIVRVVTDEDGREFCKLEILSVSPVLFSELTQLHAFRSYNPYRAMSRPRQAPRM